MSNTIQLPSDLYDAVRKKAAAQQKTTDALVIEWVSEHLEEPQDDDMTQAFEKEIAAFEQMKPSLLAQYAGEYVAIYQGRVVAHGDEKLPLLDQVREQFGNVVCYIEQVTADAPHCSHAFCSDCSFMTPYDKTFDPAAVVLTVTVAGVVHQRPQAELPALVDTGADISAVPEFVIKRLKLYPVGRLQLEDANAVQTPVYTYEANISLSDQVAKRIEIIATPFQFAILGRDWLQDYYLYLDGPNQRFLVSRDAFKV